MLSRCVDGNFPQDMKNLLWEYLPFDDYDEFFQKLENLPRAHLSIDPTDLECLSKRTKNALQREGIVTLEGLRSTPLQRIGLMQGIGRKGLGEVKTLQELLFTLQKK